VALRFAALTVAATIAPELHTEKAETSRRWSWRVPLANAELLAHLIPHAKLFTIDDGHLFLITRANEVAPVIMRFLAEPLAEDGKLLMGRVGVRLRRLARRLRRMRRQGAANRQGRGTI
jgi:hypothetical protein